jgi:hypothetical protein
VRTRALVAAALAVALAVASVLAAGGLWADAGAAEVLARSVLFGSSPALSLRVTMEIRAPSGAKTRELELYVRRDGQSLRVRAQVVAPVFLREMKLLWLRDGGGARSAWLKTSQGVRQIGGEGGGERLFDSDFTVEDLTEIDARSYTLRDAGTRVVGGRDCRVIEAAASASRPGGARARKEIAIDAASMLTRSVEYYDASGKAVKRYTVLATQRVGDEDLPLETVMEDLVRRSSTTLRFTSVQAPASLPDRLFSRADL